MPKKKIERIKNKKKGETGNVWRDFLLYVYIMIISGDRARLSKK